jgi:hypothetical protein
MMLFLVGVGLIEAQQPTFYCILEDFGEGFIFLLCYRHDPLERGMS